MPAGSWPWANLGNLRLDVFKKRQYEKVGIEIAAIKGTTERIIEIVLNDGRVIPIRRDLIEIYTGTAYLPRWLYEKIIGD
jgi:hypothetical protein